MESTRLNVRSFSSAPPSRSELWLRYGAAAATTLLAIAGAQLVSRTDFCLLLAIITLVGIPISVVLRNRDMRFGSFQLNRTLWNGFVVLLTFLAATYFLLYSLGDAIGLIMNEGFGTRFWLRFGANQPLILLIQLFSLFAALRSFALITDKDATLTTVPSFSVLLLLIPVHKGLEVVIYFLIWTFVAALLFALDHRVEQRGRTSALVEAPLNGQGEKLAARSLATIMGLALVGAVALSAYLTARDADERSNAESAIASLASRLSQFAFALPDQSATFGVERQIDFSSGPALPSERRLWQVRAVTLNGEVIQPDYWRLFTLSSYSGTTWSQSSGAQTSVKRGTLTRQDWPLPRYGWRNGGRRFRGPGAGFYPGFGGPGMNRGPLNQSRQLPPGFRVGKFAASTPKQYGGPLVQTRQLAIAQTANLGYVPLLPSVNTVILPESQQGEVRVRSDGAVDTGVVEAADPVRALSTIPALQEYGFRRGRVPTKVIATREGSPKLSAAERRLNLALPVKYPRRVKDYADSVLRSRNADENNYVRAQKLAVAIQQGATYTLRPPAIPTGRDATDFFLFDGNRRGYCTYFAGALAVLCRTQGIPARVVSGFATPDYNSEGMGMIKEADAHAWTEIWVENWGWALVDATPADERGDNVPGVFENWSDWVGASIDNALRWTSTHLMGVAMVATFVFSLAVMWKYRGRLWLNILGLMTNRSSEVHEMERRLIFAAYGQATRTLERRFRRRFDWETPAEWLQAARESMPTASFEALDKLTELYLKARFSEHKIDREVAKQAQVEAGKWRVLTAKKERS